MAALENIRTGQTPDNAIVAEANHRIANHLALLASTVQIQSSSLSKGPATLSRDDAKRMMQEIASKIVSVGNLHRRLSAMPHGEKIDIADYLMETSTNVVSSLGLGDRVHLSHKLDAHCHVQPEQAQPVALLVSEIMMNALKHAHPTGVPVQIHFSCNNSAEGGLHIEISDDGIGLPEDFDPELDGGVGLKLIRSLADKLHAALRIESDSLGVSFNLYIPPQKDSPAIAAS